MGVGVGRNVVRQTWPRARREREEREEAAAQYRRVRQRAEAKSAAASKATASFQRAWATEPERRRGQADLGRRRPFKGFRTTPRTPSNGQPSNGAARVPHMYALDMSQHSGQALLELVWCVFSGGTEGALEKRALFCAKERDAGS